MECQFIEKGNNQLFSVYHEPQNFLDSNIGVVLCNPLGQEYIRCHKLYSNLANSLSLRGFHVLRFDYYGTGDSSGEFSSIVLPELLNDIEIAVQELTEACGLDNVLLLGVRFGGTLALQYSKKHPVDGLVLWCPVLSGNGYLKEIEKSYKDWLSGSFTIEKKKNRNKFMSFGFSYPENLVKAISSISINEQDYNLDNPILLIDNLEKESYLGNKSNVTFENSLANEFWIKKEDEQENSLASV